MNMKRIFFLYILVFPLLFAQLGCKKNTRKELEALKKRVAILDDKIANSSAKSTTFSITFDSYTPLYYKSLFDIKPNTEDIIVVFLKNQLAYSMLPQKISDSLILRYTIEQVGVTISLYKNNELYAPKQPQTFTFKVVAIPNHTVDIKVDNV